MEIANFRKILTAITLAFLISSNLSAVEFDLPANTPGRSVITAPGPTHGNPALVQKTISTVPNVNCEHVIVPNSLAATAFSAPHPGGGLIAAMAADGNIYFPENGEQPTEAEAEVLSCATIDVNNINSPITDWYVRMFGGQSTIIHPVPAILQIGFSTLAGVALNALTPRPVSESIITMDANMAVGTRRADFWTDFRRIASSRIGRILLYRILIEIIRQRNIGGWKAYVSADITVVTSALNLRARANCRGLIISWTDEGNSFSKNTHTIKYANRNRKLTTICEKMGNNHPISLVERDSHIGLFHEMVHWFHVLRHPQRHSEERVAYEAAPLREISLIDNSRVDTLGRYFWGGIAINANNSWKVSASPWIARRDNQKYVNFEEIRTILGAPTVADYAVVQTLHALRPYIFFNGDDLSENKYRASLGIKIRFGHSNEPFYEDENVIQKVMNVSGAIANNLVNITEYNALEEGCRPECKIGLGKFRVGGYNIEGVIP